MGYKIGLLALGFFCLMSNIQAQDALKKADKYYELYAFRQAIPLYEGVLRNNPNNYYATSRLAECYRQTGDLSKARQWYAKAVQNPNVDPVDIFYYGQMLRSEGRYSEAKAHFLEYAKSVPALGKHYADACDYAIANTSNNSKFSISSALNINSIAADFAPAFYKNQLMFSTFRKSNGNNEPTFNQLYVSTRDNTQLTYPEPLKKSSQIVVNEGNPSFTSNGKRVAYIKNNNNFTNGVIPLIGSGVKLGIYLADVVSQNDWQNEESFVYNGRKYSNGYPHLNAEGNVIYFASDVPHGYGGFDIYMCERIGNDWSEPVNLGSSINTGGDEISPFLLGNTLFFASNWHSGYGGLDIFKSLNINNTWKQAVNMGKGINSPRDDYDFIYDNNQKVGFFSSNRAGGSGYSDIYQAEGILVAATPPTTVTVPTESMLIILRDEITEKLLEGVKIDFTRCSGRTYSTDSSGTAILDYFDEDCTILISKNGYGEQLHKLPFIAQLDIKLTPNDSKAKPDKIKDFIQRLESRKDPFKRMSKRIGKNEKHFEKITTSDFINFGGLTCGDHVSKAIDIYGTNYIIYTDSYKYDNGSFVLHLDKNQKITGIDIFGIEGVEFISSKEVNDNRIYLMGLETYKILDFPIGEGTLNKGSQYRYYEFGTHSLRLTATRNNHYIVSEIFVRWDTNKCSTY